MQFGPGGLSLAFGGNGGDGSEHDSGGGGGGAGLGGAIFIRAGSLSFSSRFTSNAALAGHKGTTLASDGLGKGGALFIHAGATANACPASFSNNSATDALGSGTDTDDVYGVLTMEPCNRAPVAQSRNVTVSAGASCTANDSINDGSYDPDAGDTITLSQLPAGPYTLGVTGVALTVTDSHGAADSSTSAVTVEDKTRPVITLTGTNPLTLECATAFSDPGARAMDNCSAAPLVTATGTVNVNVPGSYSVLYSADDGHGNIATATRTVNIADRVAPLLTLKPDVAFWPPNHKYAALTISQMVQSSSDACNSTVAIGGVVIEKVTSDEPDNAPGDADGNTTGDILIAADCRSMQLRSERDETKNGRVYVVTVRVTDASGNATRRDFKVSVPIGQGTGPAIQGATALTRTSTCQ